jgi:hypothetical protein
VTDPRPHLEAIDILSMSPRGLSSIARGWGHAEGGSGGRGPLVWWQDNLPKPARESYRHNARSPPQPGPPPFKPAWSRTAGRAGRCRPSILARLGRSTPRCRCASAWPSGPKYNDRLAALGHRGLRYKLKVVIWLDGGLRTGKSSGGRRVLVARQSRGLHLKCLFAGVRTFARAKSGAYVPKELISECAQA